MRKPRLSSVATATVVGLVLCTIVLWPGVPVVAQDNNDPSIEVLTRGPIHEAFAKPGATDNVADIEVARQPPSSIEELPPDVKPAGSNVTWISGYWSWDTDRKDFIWVSGVWRVPPENYGWVPGYWAQNKDAWRWVAGYWKKNGTTPALQPAPPQTVDIGPNSEAPGSDYMWVPGCWIYQRDHYVWRPGYWLQSPSDRMYVPDGYVWTPDGYVYAPGYWDYPFGDRGMMFAPAYFASAAYTQPGFVYTPSVVIDTDLVFDELFVSPACGTFFFGDFFAPSFIGLGIFPWFDVDFRFCPGFFDPGFAFFRCHGFRGDRDFADHFRRDFRDRRDHADRRPAHTFREQQRQLSGRSGGDRQGTRGVARDLKDVVRDHAGNGRFATVDNAHRQTLAQQGRDRVTERQTAATQVASRTQRDTGATTGRNTRTDTRENVAARSGDRTVAQASAGAASPRGGSSDRSRSSDPGRTTARAASGERNTGAAPTRESAVRSAPTETRSRGDSVAQAPQRAVTSVDRGSRIGRDSAPNAPSADSFRPGRSESGQASNPSVSRPSFGRSSDSVGRRSDSASVPRSEPMSRFSAPARGGGGGMTSRAPSGGFSPSVSRGGGGGGGFSGAPSGGFSPSVSRGGGGGGGFSRAPAGGSSGSVGRGGDMGGGGGYGRGR